MLNCFSSLIAYVSFSVILYAILPAFAFLLAAVFDLMTFLMEVVRLFFYTPSGGFIGAVKGAFAGVWEESIAVNVIVCAAAKTYLLDERQPSDLKKSFESDATPHDTIRAHGVLTMFTNV